MSAGLTVALPIYNSRDIAWLSLSSLCNQINVNFEWELIIIQEEDGSHITEDEIRFYESSLLESGCVDIKYKGIKERMPLVHKWVEMAKIAHPKSKVYVLQAADCYSPPMRLKVSYDLIIAGYNWVHSRFGHFYNIKSKSLALYDHWLTKGKTGLNLATTVDIMKMIPLSDRGRIIDNYIYTNINDVHPIWDTTDNWKFGLDTDGLNNISVDRALMINQLVSPFIKTDFELDQIVPKWIANRLENIVLA